MKPHIEKEYKMMINEELYDYYLNNLPLTTIHQTNHYYLTGSRSHACRIREIDGKYIFTLKVKLIDAKEEYEFEIKENSLNDPRIKELFNQFRLGEPEYIGDLICTRNYHDYKYGQFCLDRCEYLGKIDYEIEFELFDSNIDNKDELDKILQMKDLKYTKSYASKFGRFLEAQSSLKI